METYLAALARATGERLSASSEPWADRIYKDIAPSPPSGEKLARPYVVFMLAGGGRVGHTKKDYVSVLWQVKAVANTQESAYECRARITALMNNADRGTARELDGGDDWHILTFTEMEAIDLSEIVDGNRIYHAAADYRVLMESKEFVI